MDFDAVVNAIKSVATALGLEAVLLPVALGLAILLRFLRAGFEAIASGWMYVIVLPVGVLVAAFPAWFGGSGAKPGATALAFIAITLLMQRALQGIADIPNLPSWLRALFPADNQYVKPTAAPTPPTDGGN